MSATRAPHAGGRPEAAVIGAGPAGATVALALARAGVPALIVERGDGRGDTIGESLPPKVMPLLERLGLRKAFLAGGHLPCHGNRSSWGGDGAPLDHDFIRDPHGPGWHLDRPRFEAMLRDAAVAAGARCLLRSRLTDACRPPGGPWRLTIAGPEGSETVAADFVIDAGGRTAAFARRQGARRRRFDRLVAVTAFLAPESEPAQDSTTLVEARPDGWWYSALLPDGRLAAAFMTDGDLPAARHARNPAGWQVLLAESTHTRARIEHHRYHLAAAPTARAGAGPRVVNAASGLLDPSAGDGWLACGDAAASFDPLSSHGIGTALWSGQKAAAAVCAHLAGDGHALSAYAEQVCSAYALYLRMWRAYYAEERRWPDAPFWQRRQG